MRHAWLLIGTALSCTIANAAYAQTNDAPVEAAGPDTEDAEIVVTGSRIRGVAPVGSNLIAIDQKSIQASGATSAADVLRQVPQITSLSINAEGATGQGASSNITRATGPNLRGLGQTATLVLLDGNRMPISGTQGNFIDPSFLPTIALERIEVIADGASAIYGSDAVAGVINLIPRKTFKGAEVRARVGLADGYQERQLSGIVGVGWESGNLVVAGEWLANDALLASSRDFASSDRRYGGGADARTTACSRATITAGGGTYAVPASASGTFDFGSLTPGSVNRCDTEKLSAIIPDQDRKSGYAHLTQSLGDKVEFFAQGVYSRRTFSGPLSGQPTTINIEVPTSNPWYPTNAPAGPIYASTNFLDTTGPQIAFGESQTWQALGGVDVKLGRWAVQLTGSYGESMDEMDRTPGISTASLSAALANPNPAQSINPFGTSTNDPALVQSLLTDLFNPEVTNRLRTVTLEGNGPLFALPGGDVRMAAGATLRSERSFGTFTFGSTSFPISMSSDIERTSKAAFAEFYVPLVGTGNAMSGVQSLDLLVALRHENYSDFGSTTNPKIGLNWSPVSGLRVRGSYGTSFRAPGLSEVDPNSSGAGIYNFPVAVPGQTLPLNLVLLAAGNPDLRPEKAKTWSLGFDLTPASIPGLRLSATYFDVSYDGQIVDVFTIVPQVLAEPQNFSHIAFLNDGSARWQQAVAFIQNTPYYTPGSINFNLIDGIVDARKQNLGKTKATGLDLDLSYAFDIGENRISLSTVGTLYFKYANSTGAGALIDRLNTYGNPQRFRARALAGWLRGPASIQATLNYLGNYENLTSALVQKVSSYTTVDLDIGYDFARSTGAPGLRLGLNARNLFGRKPPFVDAGLGYDPSAALALGRIVSLSASIGF